MKYLQTPCNCRRWASDLLMCNIVTSLQHDRPLKQVTRLSSAKQPSVDWSIEGIILPIPTRDYYRWNPVSNQPVFHGMGFSVGFLPWLTWLSCRVLSLHATNPRVCCPPPRSSPLPRGMTLLHPGFRQGTKRCVTRNSSAKKMLLSMSLKNDLGAFLPYSSAKENIL